MLRITDVVKNLIIINVIVFFGTSFLPLELQDWFKLYSPLSEHFQPVQIVTSMFSHADLMHLFFNMIVLYFFGPPLEALWGAKRFLFFYFIAGFGAWALHLGVNYIEYLYAIKDMTPEMLELLTQKGASAIERGKNYVDPVLGSLNWSLYQTINTPVLGASGATSGVMVGFALNYPDQKMGLFFIPVQIAAKHLIFGLLALDFIGGFTGFSLLGRSNIAHFAHIGGAVFGFLLILYWRKFGSRL